MERNRTVRLDEEPIWRATALASERGTLVSELVAQQIVELTATRDRYRRARESTLQMMARACDRGGRSWTREELREDRLGPRHP